MKMVKLFLSQKNTFSCEILTKQFKRGLALLVILGIGTFLILIIKILFLLCILS